MSYYSGSDENLASVMLKIGVLDGALYGSGWWMNRLIKEWSDDEWVDERWMDELMDK